MGDAPTTPQEMAKLLRLVACEEKISDEESVALWNFADSFDVPDDTPLAYDPDSGRMVAMERADLHDGCNYSAYGFCNKCGKGVPLHDAWRFPVKETQG